MTEPTGNTQPRVLVAEDVEINRELAVALLRSGGVAVDAVADGVAAVEAARVRAYSLILMDLVMPRMTGVEAARAIRRLPAPAGTVPIVALTASDRPEDLLGVPEVGMAGVVTKPFDRAKLLAAVERWARVVAPDA